MSVFPTKKLHNQNYYIIITKINYFFMWGGNQLCIEK